MLKRRLFEAAKKGRRWWCRPRRDHSWCDELRWPQKARSLTVNSGVPRTIRDGDEAERIDDIGFRNNPPAGKVRRQGRTLTVLLIVRHWYKTASLKSIPCVAFNQCGAYTTSGCQCTSLKRAGGGVKLYTRTRVLYFEHDGLWRNFFLCIQTIDGDCYLSNALAALDRL